MSFLNFFKKAPKGPSIKVRVWVNQDEKEKACIKMAQAETTLIFMAWSKVTCEHFQELFEKKEIPNKVMTTRDVLPSRMTGRNFVFLERHYDVNKENKFLKSLNANEVLALVSLDDPLMLTFNANRIKEVMDSMGHQEGDYIEHEMINKSIERAMEKIKNSGLPENSSEGMKNWMEGII